MLCALWTVWTMGAMIRLSQEGSPDWTSVSCDHALVCDGRSRSFTSIPSGLMATIQSLDLSNNKITYVGRGDLQRYARLQALMLQSNAISTIEKDAFSSLRSLELLDLSDNQLSNLSSSWFQPLSSLKFLNLMRNPYRTLGDVSLFSHLTSLRTLKVGSIHTVLIQRVDFAGLTFLEELEVIASSLQSYEPGSFKSIQSISHLILHLKQPIFLTEIFGDLLSSVRYLELRATDLNRFQFLGLSVTKTNPVIRKLAFRNAFFTDVSFKGILRLLQYASRLVELEFDGCTLNGVGDFEVSDVGEMKYIQNIETVTIRRLLIPKFYLFYDLSVVYSLAGNVKRVTVENSKVFLVPCSFSQHLKSLEYLDLSENLMVEEYLKNSACEGGWPSLQTLILRQNHLTSIEETANILLTLKNLTHLDLSRNNFHSMAETCQWPAKMKSLNLSSTRIHRLTRCIPPTLQVLDVSNNNLNSFSLFLPQLTELYISQNKLTALPDASFLPELRVMKISRNTVTTFSKEQLDAFHQLKVLEAGGNTFICSCELLSFTQEQPMLAEVLLDWPDEYHCDSPFHLRGQRLQDTRRSISECHKTAVVSGVCCALLLFILLTGGLCHRFHGLWYMKMTWAWLQAKRKPRKAPARDLCYDAFVSYSERDAGWVENLMVQELEHFNPPFKLCLHKRDFIPGKWIMDNIVDSIEKSHKTVFVLSENFVRSEWCNYELDFSHFRLFDENHDAIILVLLEPIEKKAIPQRFCKLRRIMNTRTYLEWPRDEALQEGFWASLRTAIKS
ncbi:toll-like receptor 2 [Thomomys bottae]